MKIYTPSELNAMSIEDRRLALESGFGQSLHASAAEHVTWIFWARDRDETTEVLGQASAFMLDRGNGPMLITAAHVYRQYLRDQLQQGPLRCQVANTNVNRLGDYLIACGNLDIPMDEPDREPDIATFRLPEGAAARIGKRPILALAGDWPPPPNHSEQVMFCGFPAQERRFVSVSDLSFGIYSGFTGVSSVTDHQITARLERDFMIDQLGTGLPPLGYGLGGISGGPLLVPVCRDGAWAWRLGGVIVQATEEQRPDEVLMETVVAHRAEYIQANGTFARML